MWLDEPKPGLSGEYAILDDALFAYQVGAATRDDLFYMFLSPPKQHRYVTGVHLLYQFSGRKVHADQLPQLEHLPIMKEIVDACRQRILEVECKRGQLSTAASGPACNLRSVPGMRNLFRLLAALGDVDSNAAMCTVKAVRESSAI
ncbi:MAG TPA: DUF5724 domain-containing protein [Anaerolineales bacterium]|nr:DUF5724 domain-containing protein [Anaerolineales bacterium]